MSTDTQDKPFAREAIDALRARMAAFKEGPPARTWKELGQLTGVNEKTIAAWVPGTYDQGEYWKNQEIPARVERFLATLAEQSDLKAALPAEPEFQDTPTAKKIMTVLALAHQGDVGLVSTAPGCGKTVAVARYQGTRGHVYSITGSPQNKGVQDVLATILEAMGDKQVKGTPRALARQIMTRLSGVGALIIIDEAQHITFQAFEAVRAIHDATGIGVALVGDEKLPAALRNHAQLHSRIGARHVQGRSLPIDIDALSAAWGVQDAEARKFLRQIGGKHGGLRTVTKTLKLARRLAVATGGQAVTVNDLQDAFAQRYAEHA